MPACSYRWPRLPGHVTCDHAPREHTGSGCTSCACPLDQTGNHTDR